MNAEYYDVSTIESYLKGEMNASERQDFEARLMADETLRREVNAYRQIFDGFQGLKEAAFSEKVAEWTLEAKQRAEQTAEKGHIIPISRGARYRTLWKRIAVAASFTLLLGAGTAWWASRHYNNYSLVQNVYVPPYSDGTMGEQPQHAGELEEAFEMGHVFFQKGNYAEAAQQFDRVIQSLETNPQLFDDLTRKFYLENATWTKLLAEFAGGKMNDDEFTKALTTFANEPGSEYAEKAKDLKKNLGSFWRKIGR